MSRQRSIFYKRSEAELSRRTTMQTIYDRLSQEPVYRLTPNPEKCSLAVQRTVSHPTLGDVALHMMVALTVVGAEEGEVVYTQGAVANDSARILEDGEILRTQEINTTTPIPITEEVLASSPQQAVALQQIVRYEVSWAAIWEEYEDKMECSMQKTECGCVDGDMRYLEDIFHGLNQVVLHYSHAGVLENHSPLV